MRITEYSKGENAVALIWGNQKEKYIRSVQSDFLPTNHAVEPFFP